MVNALFVMAVALGAALPAALGSALRQEPDSMSIPRNLKAEEYQAVMSRPPPFCYIETGFDYVGNDIGNAPGNVDSCCNACSGVSSCKAWSWTNHNGGTCWFKSARGAVVANPNVMSALFFYGNRGYCQLQADVDYAGNDLARVNSATAEGCCDLCHNFAGCRAYTWTNHLGGSCWLKSKAGQAVYSPGAKAAEAYPWPDNGPSVCAVELNTDYVGNDMGSRPSAEGGACCDICKRVEGCRAFSWTNHNGGTCWLKNLTGNKVTKVGVVSAKVYDNPATQCTLENGLDYVGNDIGNAPSADAQFCCSICTQRAGCGAFTWSDHNGGTCWLKSSKGATASKVGVKSAVIS